MFLLLAQALAQSLDNDDKTREYKTVVDHFGDDDNGQAYQQLSEWHFKLGENEEALFFAQQALEIRRDSLGNDDDVTGETYLVLGKILLDRADFATAAPCFQAALETFRNHRGPHDDSVADALYCIGCVHECRYEWDDAMTCFQKALIIRQDNHGRDHELVADVLFRLGMAHRRRDANETDLALACFLECLRIHTKSEEEDDEDDYNTISVADTLFELAGILTTHNLQEETSKNDTLDHIKCYVDAIRIYRKAGSLEKQNHDIKIAKCLGCLGGNMEQNDVDKARKCYQQALDIFEAELPAKPPTTLMMDYRLEQTYEAYIGVLLEYAAFLDRNYDDDDDDDSIVICRRAVSLLQSVPCEHNPDIDKALCQVLDLLEPSEESLRLLRKVEERKLISSTIGRIPHHKHWWSDDAKT